MAGPLEEFETGVVGIGIVAVLIGVVLVALWLKDKSENNDGDKGVDSPVDQYKSEIGREYRDATDKFALADVAGYDGYSNDPDTPDNQALGAFVASLIPDSVRENPGSALQQAGIF